ncbi:MAG: PorT family protein [Bacteroidetes bacterium]|jgi:hypothetical protein|nr:PorT family protein [Bacteroidota bacterium]MDF1866160.1 porin family protein [Saprospiraceae bacterium]
MKKSILFAFILGLAFTATAQLKVGIKAGMSTYDIDPAEVDFSDLKIAINEANYNFHFGGFVRGQIGNFYVQPEVLWNSNSVDFRVDDFGDGLVSKVFKEKYNYLDVPLLVGLKLGPLRVNTGPVGHIFMNSKSDFDGVDDFEARFKEFTMGWQAGIGLDIWKFMVDLKYEGNFSDFGEHLTVAGQPVDFNQKPKRLMLTLGMSF